MAEAGRKQGRTNFAVACSLLSQYIKEKGSVADLGLGIAKDAAKGDSPSFRPPPTTICLLPGADISSGEDCERENEREVVSHENPMKLFPQRAPHFVPSPSEDPRGAEKSQLTIFYGGKVLVFDSFPAEKAKDLIRIASEGNSTPQNFSYVPPSFTTSTVASSTSLSRQNSTLVNLPRSAEPNLSDLPIARKVSLQRFLEKRKDRIDARGPYQMVPTPRMVTSSMNHENKKSWLGLGPNFSTPTLSLSSE
ncbi:protein TIFY 10a-like [Curcuma longa]|uniref:protein TIFY 10a-like n=1 Tax=Curcuma longa TaxID=136217 RepID=UPI003D9EBE47